MAGRAGPPLALVAACLTAWSAASAQTVADASSGPDTLVGQELVFSASRYAQSLAETPASVSIITREEIEGDYNTRLLLMVDGHRVNDPVGDNAYMGTEGAVDLAAIERVELIRGPGSSFFGTNAFYAVINVITRQSRAPAGGYVEAEAGSFGSDRMNPAKPTACASLA